MRALVLRVFRSGLGTRIENLGILGSTNSPGANLNIEAASAASMARRAERRDGAEYILVPQQQRPLDAGVVA